MKYIVIEIQTNQDGSVGNIVTVYDNQNDAESKYHSILASAATSTVPVHTAVVMLNDGSVTLRQAYYHTNE